jgi:hypothetical protein
MPVRYSKQIEKTGASIGAVVSIVRPSTYTTSATESIEASNWSISSDYPGWLECDGRTLNVSEYSALYSVIGNTYGGIEGSTFNLPDYRSKKLCGTGSLNGNSGASLGLPTLIAPNGISGGAIDIAGSSGGNYTLSTFRQLPSGSEITPGSPSDPGVIGGSSIDTFSLGTFRSSGFTSVTDSRETVLSGNVSFQVGPISDVAVSAVPVHTHQIEVVEAGTIKATQAPAAPLGTSYNFFEDAEGTVRSFNRARRPWPAGGGAGFGGFAIEGEPSTFVADGSLVLSGGAVLSNYGSGTGEFNGFASFGSSVSNQYIYFKTDTFRSATWTINGTQAEVFYILAIAGNDSNGGERVNTTNEGLRLLFNGVQQVIPAYSGNAVNFLLPSRQDFSPDFESYDEEFQDWKYREVEIPEVYRTNPLVITMLQSPANSESDSASAGIWDNFGIGQLGVTGGGTTFEYAGAGTPIVLQRHSHMIYWEEPNIGDSVPSTAATFGTGGGVDLDYTTGLSNGLRSGATSSTIVPTNSSIGPFITKTIAVVEDVGMSIRPATITMSDASRIAFDNAVSVRLEAAEELVLLSPYFRTKYIIKAY